MENVTRISLNGEWYLKGFDHSEGGKAEAFSPICDLSDWMKAEVPGVVHLDLLRAKKIPDPFYRMEELEVSWVEKKDWWYRKDFSIPEELMSKEVVEIRFNGLDTFATIWLNGQAVEN